MKENEKRRFIIVGLRGRSRRPGLEDVDVEIVNSDDARRDARGKTWEWLRMGHGGLVRNPCHCRVSNTISRE